MTRDEIDGMDWWNAQTQTTRAIWLQVAKSAVAADAWEAYKAMRDSGQVKPATLSNGNQLLDGLPPTNDA
jgi:hypothetical protein